MFLQILSACSIAETGIEFKEGTRDKQMRKSERQLNIEILRIICMTMVVSGHALMATGVLEENNLSLMNNLAWLMRAFLCVAVNCYFLITGYFGEGRGFRVERILSLWLETFFYSAAISVIAYFFGNESVTRGMLMKSFLPVTFKRYWFMQTYIVLALLQPVINRGIRNINFKQYVFTLLVLFFFFSLHETFIPVANTLDTTQGYGIGWGIVMYLLGAFIRRYGDKMRFNRWLCGSAYVVVCVLTFVSEFLVVRFNIASGLDSRGNFYAYNSVTMLVAATSLFLFWIKTSVNVDGAARKIILWLSGSALAVYLISAHPVLFSGIWTECFRLEQMSDRWCQFLVILGETMVVYIVCAAVEKIRVLAFRPIERRIGGNKAVKLIDKLWLGNSTEARP